MTTHVSPSVLLERRALQAFLLLTLVSGGASVARRLSFAKLDSFWASASWFALAVLAFWALVYFHKLPFPHGRALMGAVVFGTLTTGLAIGLIACGLVANPASLYQILMALVPLLTMFLSAVHGVEGITQRGVFGSSLAMLGIAFTAGGAGNSDISLPHIIAILITTAFIAEGGGLVGALLPSKTKTSAVEECIDRLGQVLLRGV